jgi:precorrin-3B synthase
VARTALGHRRTGLCPTFSLPTLQRDGYLLRVPLIGGLLDVSQVECLAEVARQSSNGIVELTNRGNLQLRGLARGALAAALEACRAVGLGDADASLVTISPFAAPAEHRVRATLVRDLANLDLERLSRKFVVHVDDAEGTTADRSADLSIRLVEGRYETTVRALGTTTCGAEAEAARLARRLAELCIQHGPHSRAPDVVATEGPEALAAALGATHAWLPSKPARRSQPPPVGVTVLPRPQTAPSSRAGPADANHVALAAARFGRVNAAALGAIGHLLRRHRLTTVRITPWRAFAFTCSSAAQAAAVVADAASIGLLTDRQDPAVGVIACIGALGCWQTQLDTLAEAECFAAHRPAELEPGALVHVSGCDKFCATRATVALTLLGRTDQTGFDALGRHAE